MANTRLAIWLSVALVGGTLLAFAPVGRLGFLRFDDQAYVTANAVVRRGLTADGWVWAWTRVYASNWHPLTWLSHMLDCQLFGLNPVGHHLVNLLFHVSNTLLLFHLLRAMTRQTWRPAVVAALFALHPLRVESVAWVAERKDVLSTFFGLLALGAYVGYCRRPGLGRYLLVVALFVLSLLAKPMWVTLPFVLLLLDYWPLRRLERPGAADASREGEVAAESFGVARRQPRPSSLPALIVEKVPLLVLAVLSSVVTVLAQRSLAMMDLAELPLPMRLASAVVSYVAYLGLMLWPFNLAIFYPFARSELTFVPVLCCSLFLLVVTGVTVALWRRQPALLVGWSWYLGMLLPVIGLVQVGMQARADRYTYVPLIGMFLALAWSVPDAWFARPTGKVIQAGVVGILVACVVLTRLQLRHWENDRTLWSHALEVTRNNAVAEDAWGSLLVSSKEVTESEEQLRLAEEHLRRAVELEPRYNVALNNLGLVLLREGQVEQARDLLSRAVAAQPRSAANHNSLGLAQLRQGCLEEAVQSFREASRLDPDVAEFPYNLAFALDARGERQAAAEAYAQGRQLDPTFAERALQTVLFLLHTRNPRLRCLPEALFRAQQAKAATEGKQVEALVLLAEVWAASDRPAEAAAEARQALAVARTAGRSPEQLGLIEGRLHAFEATRPGN